MMTSKPTNNQMDNSLNEFELLAAKVLEKIPTGTEEVRLAPRPLFIEFCGTPKSGKTTCATRLTHFLNRNGFNVITVAERASVCPLRNKSHMTFNVWTACSSLNEMLEAVERDYQIVVFDRGIFDALCWMNFMELVGRLSQKEKETIFSFLLMERWRSFVDIVFLMTTTPKEALRREYQDQLTQREGSIMNERTLTLFNKSIKSTAETMAKDFPSVVEIDTTNLAPADGIRQITKETLLTLDHFLDEEVMVIDRSLLWGFNFDRGVICEEGEVNRLFDLIEANHSFRERRDAEVNSAFVQIIPCGIIEHEKSIMLLRRKERDSRDRLHNKYAIWAGGHARKQDKTNGKKTIRAALDRELNEELFVRASQKETLVAFLYDQSDPRSSLHLGVVYRVDVDSPEVYLAMEQQEFKEKRGLSVSGRFFLPEEIGSRFYPELEAWSRALLVHYYKVSPPAVNGAQPTLSF
jgi:predicted NUDIX family phosphoesterase/thymidylate kinase